MIVVLDPHNPLVTTEFGFAHDDTFLYVITKCCSARLRAKDDDYECEGCHKMWSRASLPIGWSVQGGLEYLQTENDQIGTGWIEAWTGIKDAVITIEGDL